MCLRQKCYTNFRFERDTDVQLNVRIAYNLKKWYNAVSATNKKTTKVYATAAMLSLKLVEAKEANDTVRDFI